MNFGAPKLSLWLLTVLIIFSSWEFYLFIYLFYLGQVSPVSSTVGREVPPHFHSFSSPSFLSSTVSTFIPSPLNIHLSDIHWAVPAYFFFLWEKERNLAEGNFCVTFAGCLGRLCTPSWLEWTATPPAWGKSGSLCSSFSESWFWSWLLRAFGEMNSLTSPATPCR